MFFLDLLEDAIIQSTRSLSEKRNRYIATFLAINKEISEEDFSVKKKLLHSLESLTDRDIDILQSLRDVHYTKTYWEYATNRQPIGYVNQLSPEERYEYDLGIATWDAHINSLLQHKLVYAIHKTPPDDPDIDQEYLDRDTGLAEVERYEVSELGKVLLKSIGLEDA